MNFKLAEFASALRPENKAIGTGRGKGLSFESEVSVGLSELGIWWIHQFSELQDGCCMSHRTCCRDPLSQSERLLKWWASGKEKLI